MSQQQHPIASLKASSAKTAGTADANLFSESCFPMTPRYKKKLAQESNPNDSSHRSSPPHRPRQDKNQLTSTITVKNLSIHHIVKTKSQHHTIDHP
eukprot:UN29801